MGDLVIDENFESLLDPHGVFEDSRKCFLWVRGKSKEGHPIKKKARTNEKYKVKNIRTLLEAKYGYSEDRCIDVFDKIKDIMDTYNIAMNIRKSNETFFSFCNTLMKVICPRCYNNYAQTKLNPHNHGYLNIRILQSHPLKEAEIFHGIMKCYVAYVINEDKNIIPKKKERFIECFTDLIVNKNYSTLPHFHIANLVFNYNMGFSVDKEDYEKIERRMKANTVIYIKTLFRFQYQALKYFCGHRGNIFIRHGLEKKTNKYSNQMIFPPNDDKHGWRIHNVTNQRGNQTPTLNPAYPIEIDTLPFKRCASHSSKEIYGNVKGYIDQGKFKQFGGKIHMRYEREDDVMARDHLFAESAIPVNQWVFTYRKNNSPTLKETIQKAVNAIVREGLPIIDEAILPNFMHVFEAIINKNILLH